jgi:SOS response regulatory protein OraA/RecX
MSKRLQVVMDDEEWLEIQRAAKASGVTVSQWVRQVLRRSRLEQPSTDRARKLEAVRAAARHGFPTADIAQMLAEIESGYVAE